MSVVTVFKFDGRSVSVEGYSDSDWIFQSIATNEVFYEIDLLQYMRYALRGVGGSMLDIGANIGNHSIFFGLFLKKKVVCFEPNPIVFEILKNNLIRNGIDHEVFNIGLGSYEGLFSIDDTHEGAKDNVGAVRLFKNTMGKIQVKELDNVFDEAKFEGQQVAAIKADIEGMEPEMLEGARMILEAQKPDLFLEINDEIAMRKIESILYPMGYKKLYSHAYSPVWHFSHVSKLSITRRTGLFFYTLYMKSLSLVKRVLLSIVNLF